MTSCTGVIFTFKLYQMYMELFTPNLSVFILRNWMVNTKKEPYCLGTSSPNPHPSLMLSGLLWVWIKFGCHVPSLPPQPSPLQNTRTHTHLAMRSRRANIARHLLALHVMIKKEVFERDRPGEKNAEARRAVFTRDNGRITNWVWCIDLSKIFNTCQLL